MYSIISLALVDVQMMFEFYWIVDAVQLTGVLPGISGLEVPQGDLRPVVPVNESLLVVDLDGPRGEESDSVLPGDHITAWAEVGHNQLLSPSPTFIVDIAREGHIISNFDLKALLLGVE